MGAEKCQSFAGIRVREGSFEYFAEGDDTDADAVVGQIVKDALGWSLAAEGIEDPVGADEVPHESSDDEAPSSRPR